MDRWFLVLSIRSTRFEVALCWTHTHIHYIYIYMYCPLTKCSDGKPKRLGFGAGQESRILAQHASQGLKDWHSERHEATGWLVWTVGWPKRAENWCLSARKWVWFPGGFPIAQSFTRIGAGFCAGLMRVSFGFPLAKVLPYQDRGEFLWLMLLKGANVHGALF